MTTSKPQPNQRYKDSHGHRVTVTHADHHRVTFYRDGYLAHRANIQNVRHVGVLTASGLMMAGAVPISVISVAQVMGWT